MNVLLSPRDAVESDFEPICALNLVEVQHTSAMDNARLKHLHSLSCYHKVVCIEGVIAAFLLAMRAGADYQNDNFSWFTERYKNFIYIDRIVVAAPHRDKRLGSLLYQDLFTYARQQQVTRIACEYNIVPPNPASQRFHDKFGFSECGRQWLAAGSKQVSLQVAELKVTEPQNMNFARA